MKPSLAKVQGKAEKFFTKQLVSLPSGIKRGIAATLAPRTPVRLDANIRLLLAAAEHRPSFVQDDVNVSRRLYSQTMAMLDMPKKRLEVVRDHYVPVQNGRIKLREYRPHYTGVLTEAIFFIHGGGFTIGSVDDYDNLCRWIAHTLDRPVFSVDYRLAPEHQYPVAVEDTLAAWQWLQAESLELGIDPQQIAVMGDSAGGCLAVIVSQEAEVKPLLQCLIYPTTDQTKVYASQERHGQGYGLTKELKTWFIDQYLPEDVDVTHPWVSPMVREDVSDQPPAIMITATDPLRDQGLAYGHKLEQANVPVTYFDYPKLVHGFAGMGGMVPAARRALEEICAEVNRLFKELN